MSFKISANSLKSKPNMFQFTVLSENTTIFQSKCWVHKFNVTSLIQSTLDILPPVILPSSHNAIQNFRTDFLTI